MKTIKLALLATAFAGLSSFALAGPGPQFWNRPKPAPATTSAAAPTDSKATPTETKLASACCTSACGCSAHR